ncbi:MAG: hypothetical protein AAF627_05520 [Myxococcota bacterium]
MIWLLLSLVQAPHPAYGGRLIHALPPPRLEGLCGRHGPSELLASALAFEPLVDANGASVLAREVREEAGAINVLLRTDIQTHQGRSLDAAFVARALRASASDCGWAPFLSGRPEDAILPDPLLASVRIELAARPLELDAWLARLPVALRVDGAWFGTGPFKLEGHTLRAFTRHRGGRPYVDELRFVAARRRARASPDGHLRVDWYLQVVDGDQNLTKALSAIIPSEASMAFLPASAAPLVSTRPEQSTLRGSWRLAEEPELPGRFLDRIQLDLSRRGIMIRRARGAQSRAELVFLAVWSWSDAPLSQRRMEALRAAGRLSPKVLARMELSESPPWAEAFTRSGLVPIATWAVMMMDGPEDPRRTPDWAPSR